MSQGDAREKPVGLQFRLAPHRQVQAHGHPQTSTSDNAAPAASAATQAATIASRRRREEEAVGVEVMGALVERVTVRPGEFGVV